MLDDLVERRIREAQSRGEFENLPGEGLPLPEEDNALIPQDLRAAYRLLRNSGFVPPEVEVLRNLNRLLDSAMRSTNADATARAHRRLLAISLALEDGGLRIAAQATHAYRQALLARLARAEPSAADHTA